MALFARVQPHVAEALVDSWPAHRWGYRDLEWLLKRPINKNLKDITLNEPLLESIKASGFVNPFLFTDTWYPICGSQRLRCAMEMTTKQRKNTIVRYCRFEKPFWQPFFHWYNKDEGLKCAQIYFQMSEVVFKTLYHLQEDAQGTPMIDFEEGGNKLHWNVRDGMKK